jgi:hypothetical protein
MSPVQELLAHAAPQTVRRVLPREFIEQYVQPYLPHLETMSKLFQAVLTFPTAQRTAPEEFMKVRERLFQDLHSCTPKLEAEVAELIENVKSLNVLQSHIMLKVIADVPFPFCLLNTVDYRYDENTVIPCYVVLWAQHSGADRPFKVWAQLAPVKPRKWQRFIAFEKLVSEFHEIGPQGDHAEFFAFNTAIGVYLYDMPTETEARLQGKTLTEMLHELRRLRHTVMRRPELRGNFLHIVWTMPAPDSPLYTPQIEI